MKTSYIATTLKYNCQISEITTTLKYIHNWYILDIATIHWNIPEKYDRATTLKYTWKYQI